MTLNLTIQKMQPKDFTPRITVIGVGGGGCNAVNNMITLNLPGVDFVAANTDAQQLQRSLSERRIQLGPHLTQGNGAGGNPEVGRASADEAAEELIRHMDDVHMVFITAGMGGGTGTGAAPVIARMARERNILTVGVVTKPFAFEGKKRMRAAEAGIAELQAYVDTLIVIPNQNLFKVASRDTGWKEAFEMADEVLYMGVRSVTDLMVLPGMVNLDYADIRSVMSEMGKAMMGTGEAEGENRALRAAEAAISNPLLEDTNMKGARGLLINITGGSDITLHEVDEAAQRISEEVDPEANIMVGMSLDESLHGRMRVSVVATGIDSTAPMASAAVPMPAPLPKFQVVNGGAVETTQFPPHVAGQPGWQAVSTTTTTGRAAGYVPEPPATPLLSRAFRQAPATESFAFDEPAAPPAYSTPSPNRMAPPVARAVSPEVTRPAPEPARRGASIFKTMFGIGAQPAPTAPVARQEPAVENHARAAVLPTQIDETDLDIPTFMRRP